MDYFEGNQGDLLRENMTNIGKGKSLMRIRPLEEVPAGLLFISFLLLALFSPRDAVAFIYPEKLAFDLTWTGVKAGTATLEIAKDKGQTKIVSTTRSADWVSVFYKVDDKIESLLKNSPVSQSIGLPVNYHIRVREGRHRRDKEMIFDHAGRTVTFIDHLSKEKSIFPIDEGTFDALSCFYYIRTAQFEVGKSVYVNIFDSKKLWNVEVQVLRKEKIITALGTFDTVVIKPLMKSEGVFNRKGDMYIWLTDDQRRLPVKMQTKVAVGSITATLTGGSY